MAAKMPAGFVPDGFVPDAPTAAPAGPAAAPALPVAPAHRATAAGILSSLLHVPTAQETSEAQRGAVSGSRAAGPAFLRVAGNSLPTLAAMGATALVPEAAPFAPALRLLAAGGAGAAADVPGQVMQGNRPGVMSSLERGGTEMLGQGVGEVLSAILHGTGKAALLDATGATKAMRKATPGIEEKILAERVPVGPDPIRGGSPTAGQDILRARAAENATAMGAARKASTTVHSTDDVLAAVDREIADLRASSHPEDVADAARLQARRDAFAQRNPNGVSTESLDRAVRRSQQRAQGTYTKDVNGKTVTVQTTPDEQIYHRLFARQGRTELRKVPGVAATKDRAADLIALENVYRSAEAAPPPPLPTLGNPTQLFPTLLRRSVLAPSVESRLGLLLSDPRVLAAARGGPLATEAMVRLFAAPENPDSLSQGGSR